jgi:hypothetical protein
MRTRPVRVTVLAVAAIALCVVATAAQAADIKVGNGRHALERALKHAKPGDRILLRGVVRGETTVSVPGLTIEGGAHGRITGAFLVDADHVTIRHTRMKRASVTVTGDDLSFVGNQSKQSDLDVTGDRASISGNVVEPQREVTAAFTVRGDGAVVEGNTITNFYEGVRVAGADTVLRENTFDDGWKVATVIGDGASVSDNTVRTSIASFLVAGDGASVTGNTIGLGDAHVIGDDATVTDNTIGGASGAAAVTVAGLRATVTDNTLSGSWGGARVEGDGATISGNVIDISNQGSGAAILSVGDGAVISDNSLTLNRPWGSGSIGSSGGNGPDAVRYELAQSGYDAIASFGDGTQVVANDVTGALNGGTAVRVQGDGNAVDANTLHEVARAFAAVMIGDANTADSNEISTIDGEGLVVQGANGVVTDTHVTDVSSCGFLLVGSTVLDGCSATRCNMGVVNLADGSNLNGANVSGNAPYDLVDLGHATVTGDAVVGHVSTGVTNFPTFTALVGAGFVPAPTPTLNLGEPQLPSWVNPQ